MTRRVNTGNVNVGGRELEEEAEEGSVANAKKTWTELRAEYLAHPSPATSTNPKEPLFDHQSHELHLRFQSPGVPAATETSNLRAHKLRRTYEAA